MTAPTSERRIEWPKLAAVGVVCMGQTFALALAASVIPTVFREQGLELKDLWVFSLLMVPVWLRWLWAPLVDRYGSRRFGRRTSWIVPMTLGAATAYASLAFWAPDPAHLGPVAVTLVVAAFVFQTQDIAVDAYTLDAFEPHERGPGSGVKTAFESLGDAVAGAGLLLLYSAYGWQAMVCAAALALLVFSSPVLFRRETERVAPEAVRARPPSILAFLRRPDTPPIAAILLGCGVVNHTFYPVAGVVLVDAGLSLAQVGVVVGTVYSLAYLAGATLSAWAVARFGATRVLAAIAVAYVPAYLPFVGVADTTQATFTAAAVAIALPATLLAMLHLVVTVCRMGWASPAQGATDFALQGTLYNMGRTVPAAVAGGIAHVYGWSNYLLGAALVGVAIIVLFGVYTWRRGRVSAAAPTTAGALP